VVAKVGDGPSFVDAVVAQRPDVSVVDVRMPPSQRTRGCVPRSRHAGRSRDAGAGLSQYVERQYATELLADRAAASATSSRTGWATCASSWTRCGAWPRRNRAGPEVVAQLMTPRRGDDPLESLTPREREVLARMAEGRTNHGDRRAAGDHRGRHRKHISNIFGKLQLPDSENDHRRVLAVLTYLES
jgi:DNA-binding NarL/FixJ family response regulator